MTKIGQVVSQPLVVLGVLAALCYCSWPLGFVLNPTVASKNLASALQAHGQPYSWMFIALDLISGVLSAMIGLMMLLNQDLPRWRMWVGTGLITFGSLVGIAAVTPLDCDPTTTYCNPLWHHPTLVVHGVASIVSVVSLLLALLSVTYYAYAMFGSKWRLSLLALIGGWALFGLVSLVSLWQHWQVNANQYYFITVCSLSIVAVALSIEMVRQKALRV